MNSEKSNIEIYLTFKLCFDILNLRISRQDKPAEDLEIIGQLRNQESKTTSLKLYK